MGSTVRISVVVPTKNSGRTLERCLMCVRSQTYANVEVVVVDAGSTDQTKAIAGHLADHVFELRQERSEARNYGAARSSGSHLLFLDSDMYLSPSVLKECVEACGSDDRTAIVIPEETQGQGFWARCRTMEKECYLGDSFVEAARFFPRKFFEALGGFDSSLGPAGEDWDLTIRARNIGCRVLRTASGLLHDEGWLTLRKTASKKYYYGRYLKRFTRRHGSEAFIRLTPFHRTFWKILAHSRDDPAHAFGFFILKSAEVTAALAGMVRSL